MPFFKFECPGCHTELRKLTTIKSIKENPVMCPECDAVMEARLGAPAALAKETSDEYRGKSVDQNIKENLKARSSEHFRKHELPRMIDKHGKEYATKEGFLDAEGNPVDKRK